MSWMPNTRVPTELLAPLVQEYLGKYDCEGDIAVSRLAEESGLSYEQVRRLNMKGRQNASVAFDDAEKLIAAMGMPELWFTEPLRSVYQNIDMRYIDVKYPVSGRAAA